MVMGKYILPRGLLLLLLISTSTSNSFFGDGQIFEVPMGDVELDTQEIGGSYSTSIIAEDMRLPYDGVLRTFSIKLGESAPNTSVYLQAWRHVSDKTYMLTRNKKIDKEKLKAGVVTENVNWYAAEGDYIGVSCDGYCPVLRGPKDTRYMLRISMSGYSQQFEKYFTTVFDDHPLLAMLAIHVTLEVNGPPPESTTSATNPTQVSASKSSTTTKANSGGGSGSLVTTTLAIADGPEAQGATTTGDIGIWWILVAAALVIVLLAIALVIVGASSWNRERSTLKKELLRSRPTSMISESGMHGSNFNTLARNNPGLQSINEIEVHNDSRTAHRQAVVVSVTPESRRAAHQQHGQDTVVVFDNGMTNMDSREPTPPPPPPLTMPPDQL